MRHRYLLVTLLVALLLLSACGRRIEVTEDVRMSNGTYECTAYTDYGSLSTAAIRPVRTLSILVSDGGNFENVIHQAADSMTESWIGEHYDFSLEVTVYNRLDFENNFNRLNTMLMAGQGYDMFFWAGHNLVHWARSGFLANFYDLIDECPITNRDDFFTQVLKANEIDAGVYAFPLSFGFKYVFVNDNLPQSIVSEFIRHSTITMRELMALYIQLMYDYGNEFGHLSFADGSFAFDPVAMITAYMGGFVDFSARTVNLTSNDFISFLNDLTTAFPRWDANAFASVNVTTMIKRPWMLQQTSKEYAFFAAYRFLDPMLAFTHPPYFVHGIPVTDNQGRLLIDQLSAGRPGSTWATVCIASAGDTALAWEFTRHLIQAFSQPTLRAQYRDGGMLNNSWGRYSLTTPIYRPLFHSHVSSAVDTVENILRVFGAVEDDLTDYQQADYCWQTIRQLTLETIETFNEMPISLFNRHLPLPLFFNDIDLLMRGNTSPENFAQTVQNRIRLWLIE